ncbi:transposase [Acetobacter pasteurianus NBRC 101655]|nr:transposase [Acetobacter pasteurianus NBRC 101655]
MCRCLAEQPSGYYAWRKEPLSRWAREDARQTTLIRQAWHNSGRVYGYRKLHDDLLDQGETCYPNRVARLTKLAGIKAQIGYRRPGSHSGRLSLVIDNTLARQFDVEAPDRVWVTDITYSAPRPGWSGGAYDWNAKKKGGTEVLPCSLLWGSMSPTGGNVGAAAASTAASNLAVSITAKLLAEMILDGTDGDKATSVALSVAVEDVIASFAGAAGGLAGRSGSGTSSINALNGAGMASSIAEYNYGDYTRECLTQVADASLSGERLGREFDRIGEQCGWPLMIAATNGTE